MAPTLIESWALTLGLSPKLIVLHDRRLYPLGLGRARECELLADEYIITSVFP